MTTNGFRPMHCIGVALVCSLAPGCSGCVQRTIPAQAIDHNTFCARYIAAGDFELAEQRCDLAIEYSGGTYAEPWNNKAHIALGRGQLELARQYIKRALAIRNDFAEAYNNLGVTFERERQWHDAIDAYTQALERDPGYLAARRNRGFAYRVVHELGQARGDFLKCLEIDPGYCECREGLGVMALDAGDYDAAHGELAKLTQACPSYAMGHYNLCLALLHKGECSEAVSACVAAIALEPRCDECKHNLSESYACLAKQQAVGDFPDVVVASPTDPEPHYRLGRVFEEQRLLQNARDEYRAAIKLSEGRHKLALFSAARVADRLALARELVDMCQQFLDRLRGDELSEERRWCAGRVRELQLQ